MSQVVRQSVTVNLENGLHLVPCSRIAQAASNYDCDVRILRDDMSVDAKRVLELMTLNASLGTDLVLEAEGDKAANAVNDLVTLFNANFDGPLD